MATKEKFDGRSRPSNNTYRKRFNEIFNPVAKEVRTSKFKSQVVEDKTKYNRTKEKTTSELLREGYEMEKKMREDDDE